MSNDYKPVQKHWYYKRMQPNNKFIWLPFTQYDSKNIDQHLDSKNLPVMQTRYDANVKERIIKSVYWPEEPMEIRLCSWFSQVVPMAKMVPYDEKTSELLEANYKKCCEEKKWRHKVYIAGDMFSFQSANIILEFSKLSSGAGTENNSNTSNSSIKSERSTSRVPRLVSRGVRVSDIEEGNNNTADHLILLVYGIGPTLGDVKCMDMLNQFRKCSEDILADKSGQNTHLEILPCFWHEELRSTDPEMEKVLNWITLESLEKFRNFSNNSLLDILLHMTPEHGHTVRNFVTQRLNKLYTKYRQRNPQFKGKVALMGHSLGSLVLFDLLCLQTCAEKKRWEFEDMFMHHVSSSSKRSLVNDYQLQFQPVCFFALGSPIGIFLLIRSIKKLGTNFYLPNCPRFYNIFHPFDPIAFRIEPLVNPELHATSPVLIPSRRKSLIDFLFQSSITTNEIHDIDLGKINNNNRVDFVLQEKHFEVYDYLFAINAHSSYWESSDFTQFIINVMYEPTANVVASSSHKRVKSV